MAIRIRSNGDLICAAKSEPMPNDFYIDDGLHYMLSVIQKCLIADKNEETNGKWHWLHSGGDSNAGVFVRSE